MNEVTLVATSKSIAHKTIQFFCCYDSQKHLVYLEANDLTHPSLVSQIHVVRLENHVPHVGCFFVMESGQKLFLPEKETKKAICVRRMSGNKTFCQGDLFLLQVKKDALKTKDAVATATLEITDAYLSLGYPGHGFGISKKASEKDKERLNLALAEEELTGAFHVLVRTKGSGEETSLLKERLNQRVDLLKEIIRRAESALHPTCLYQGKNRGQQFLDAFPIKEKEQEVTKILTDDPQLYEELKNMTYAKVLAPLYEDSSFSLGDLYRLQTSLKELTAKTVWMKSGANLVIEPTEALTVVDVNTAKASSKKDLFSVNMEAAEKAMEQLRLRNISGIILIDFINLKNKQEQQEVLKLLCREAEKDPVKVSVLGYTATGLVEITREKIHPSLNQVLTGKIYCGNI
ncbi:MAG: ribonuclease E/G [Lachnospiraceae bacterium]|nr:ribonuclease E/G [Lachnospiraceae bacterium]